MDYEKLMGHLRQKHEALIVLLVDMVELPGSILTDLAGLVGKGKAIMVVGNKADLLPPDLSVHDDDDRYLKRYQDSLQGALEARGLHQDFNLLYTGLLSAKTGFGVENLVSQVLSHWGDMGDVYLIGCTNSGKSTLFNRLLQSDLCKVRSTDLLQRATTSVWPGTTLNLLKFPILNPAGWHLEARQQRLRKARLRDAIEQQHRLALAQQSGEPRFAQLQGHVGRVMSSNTQQRRQRPPDAGGDYFLQPPEEEEGQEDPESKLPALLDPESHPAFRESHWLHDTPGLLSEDQILEQLTLEEVIKVVPSEMLIPRTFAISPGDSLLLGGLARVEYVDGPSGVFASAFASHALPVRFVKTAEVPAYLRRYSGTQVLAVPASKLPLPLESAQIGLRGAGVLPKQALADLVLSSIGWIALTSGNSRYRKDLLFRVYTPQARGIYLRTPPLVPHAVQLKGDRRPFSQAYEPLSRSLFLQPEEDQASQ